MPTPARTSLSEIVTAGRSILESEGLDALTMQRVAGVVGVRAPSLYKRVRSRGELIGLVVEDVARELSTTVAGAARSGDPAHDLHAVARAFRRFGLGHPRSYALIFGPLPEDVRPGLDALAPATEAVLSIAGELAGQERALEGARTVVAWAYGFVSMELAGAFRLGGDIDAAFDFGIERLARALAERT